MMKKITRRSFLAAAGVSAAALALTALYYWLERIIPRLLLPILMSV